MRNRRVGGHQMNKDSSRSHSVIYKGFTVLFCAFDARLGVHDIRRQCSSRLGFSNTRFRVSGGGYSVLFEPVLTQKRGVDHLDWTFFTVMKLVACQITMELICHWLLVFGACFLKGN